jgi:hypothetical protein
MAFTVKTTETFQMIGSKAICGTYTNDSGSTGGNITLGFQTLFSLQLQPKGSAVSANQPVVNAILPLKGRYNVIAPIVTSANESGNFIAIGI